ncbi:hypothetical protein ACLMJK_008684 [Lecanora helva]
MSSNTAAWINEAKAKPFEIKSAPTYTPEENEILVKNHAVAINPIDGSLQSHAWLPLNYPTIFGLDVAGEVVSVGPNVKDFKPGARVLGNAPGMMTKQLSQNGFQAYTILPTNLASQIPDNVSYESAAVIPLGYSTAAAALFQDDCLKLQLPTEPAQKSTGKTILIWGGASSVGSNAIQLAVAAGYEVITTASPKNFSYVKNLGASQVFDYNSPTIGDDLLKAFEGKTCAGAFDCIGASATPICVDVVNQSTGTKFVSTTKQGFADPPAGVTVKHVFATTIMMNHVGKAVYNDFLPKALEAQTFTPAPEPLVAGKGLESVQGAVDLLAKGVSAKKVVVSL